MFEVLEQVPAHSSKLSMHLTKQAYNNAVAGFKQHLDRAFEMYNAWWKGGDNLLFDMSLEELLKASRFMDIIVYSVGDDRTAERLSKRATFMYDLAACMMGAISED